MEAGDLIRQKRDRKIYVGKLASTKPANKTLQSDSQTLINLKLGPQEATNGKTIVIPACTQCTT